MKPCISVIIPAFNAARYLDEAIASVRFQDYPSLEILVVDDGSTDDTALVAARHADVALVRQPNRGPAAARNRGLQAASGMYIAFLDADDLWAPAMLPRLLAQFQAQPETEIVQGLIQRLRAVPQVDGAVEFQPEFNPYPFVNLGSGLYRRAVFDRVGLFDESLPDNEDTDWMIRAWECGVRKVVLTQEFLYYRVHDQSMTMGGRRNQVNFAGMMKRRLDRLRAGRIAVASGSNTLAGLHQFLGTPPPHNVPQFDEPFTVLANDCWGGDAYQSLGLVYATPFVATRIFAPCFITLLQDLDYLLEQPLHFVHNSRYDFMNDWQATKPYPLALLGGAVEVHFLHESDAATARLNWERRRRRMRRDNLFVKFSEDPGVCTREHLEAFQHLPYDYKVCFTCRPYPDLPACLPIPSYFVEGAPMFHLSRQCFDVVRWLRKASGPAIADYRLAPPAAESAP